MARKQEPRARQASGDLFPTDEPIPGSLLIGRQADVREINAALENGISLVVAGPRRTGKTSVCEAALTRAKGRGCYTVAVDLFRLADASELAEALATAILNNRPTARKLLPRARQFGRQALDTAQTAATMKMRTELGDAIEIALTPGFASQDPERALTSALELAEHVAVADNKRCILFLDEFQELANDRQPFGHPDVVTKRMRAVFQRSSHVSYLFAGSIEHVMRDLFTSPHRALAGFGSMYELGPITTDEWRAGLRVRFEQDERTIRDEALDHLIALGGGHPRITMLIAQHTHLASVLVEQGDIDLELVNVGDATAYRGDAGIIDQLVESIRTSHKLGLKVARRVAAGQSLSSGLNRTDVDRALKKLMEAGLIARVDRGEYRVLNPFLRRRLTEDAF